MRAIREGLKRVGVLALSVMLAVGSSNLTAIAAEVEAGVTTPAETSAAAQSATDPAMVPASVTESETESEEGTAEESEEEEETKEAEEETEDEEKEKLSSSFSEAAKIDGVTIRVTAAEGVFPEGATLSVSKAVAAEEAAAENAVDDVRSDDKNVAASYTYDIKVLDKDGNEIQPADSDKVTISFTFSEVADPNLSTDIYHIKEDAEVLSVSESGSTATAETDGFSLYTVEFTYTDKQYVLPGDSGVALSTILEAVGFSGEVTAVSVSDDTLFSASQNEGGQWIVTAHKAFSTEEWMKVTINGTEYEIKVTDDQLPAAKIGETTYGTIPEAITAAQSGDTIILLRDVDISAPLVFPKGKTLTLDLAGHTIDRGLANSSAAENGNVITVKGDLTITDSSEDRTGKLTGGNNYSNGGGVRVCEDDNAVFTLNGGSITGCKSDDSNYGHGGGVFCLQGKFIMNGGSIDHCTGIEGGGVYVDDTCTFNMTGGTISQNSGNEIGGVYVLRGTFNMTGGTISGNTATESSDNRAGGVCINKGTFKVSGTPVIKSNTKNGSASNIVFYSDCSDKTIKVTDELGTGAEIHVNAASGVTVAQGSNYTPTSSDAAAFHSDSSEDLAGVLDNNNGIKIGSAWSSLQSMLETGGTVTLNRDYTAGSSDSALVVPTGKTVTLDLNDHTIDRGLGNSDDAADGNVITVNGNLTLKDSGSNGTITRGNFFDGNNDGAGGVIVNGTFTMEGGKITECVSAQSGGGVYVAENGTFTMTGGTITDCFAVGDGGGVYSEGTFKVSGAPVIKDNNTSHSESKGVCLANYKKIGIIGALRNGAEIWVITNENDIFAEGLDYDITESDAAKFVCDNQNLAPILINSDNVIKMAHAYTITVADGIQNGTVTAPSKAVAGATVTLTITPDEGYVLEELTVTDNVSNSITVSGAGSTRTFTMPDGSVTVAASFGVPVAQVGDVKYTTVQGAIDAATANGTVILLSDVNINTFLTIASGKTVTLDLNGHTINRGLAGETAVNNGYVITVNGNLTLKDSGTNGTITGGNNENGTGGGVYVDSGTFTMQGGTISENQSNGPGGGVYVDSGTFNMTGGRITDNNATGSGGGVCVSENGTFNVSGAPVISGNFTVGAWDSSEQKYVLNDENANSAPDDVALAYSDSGEKSYITVSGELTSGASIYVNGDVAERPDTAIVGANNYTIKESDVGYFHSDVSTYTPAMSSDGKVVFKTQAGFVASPQRKVNSSIYNGEGQGMFIPADVNGGTVKYAVSHNCLAAPATSDYSEDIPEVKDVGDYYLWYYVEGNDYYIGTAPEYVEDPVTIQPCPITVTEGITAANKSYDGTTEATLDTSDATLSGKCDDDDLTVSATGTFDDKNAGDDKIVTIRNLTLDGEDANNYVLATTGNQDTTTASISPKQITISGVTASDKEYDGMTEAYVDATGATIRDLVGTETVTVGVTGTFRNASKGNNKTVDLSDWTLSGTDAGNYEVDATHSQQTTTASITGTQVYITGLSAENKEYDGTTAAGITGTAVLKTVNGDAEVSGLTFSDITASFADKNIGEGKTVSITGVTLDDTDNYAINLERTNQALNLTANITAKPVTITGLSAADKSYDTTTTATVTGTAVIDGKLTGDNLTVTGGTAVFADANVGQNKAVTFNGYELSGTDAGNYTLSGQPASVTANITKATPIISTAPTVEALTYGQALSAVSSSFSGAATLNGAAVEGAFAWVDGTVTPAVSDSDRTRYDVTFTPTDTANLNTASCTITVTVNKADVTLSEAPREISGLIYNGNAQALITAGTVTGGTIQYKLGASGTYGTSVPKAKDAGDYTVYYKVAGDQNHNDIAETSVAVSIAQQTTSITTTPVSKHYGDSAFAITGVTNNVGATPTYAVTAGTDVISISGSTVTILKPGSATITASIPVSTNYTAATAEISVTVANGAAPVQPAATMTTAYANDKVSKVALPAGWTWADADKDSELTVGTALSATAEYTADDKDYYDGGKSCVISITRQARPATPAETNTTDQAETAPATAPATAPTAALTPVAGVTAEIIPDLNTANTRTANKTRTDSRPHLQGHNEVVGWNAIENTIKESKKTTGTSNTFTIDMQEDTKIPVEMFKAAKGSDVTLVFKVGDKVTWSVNGTDITDDVVNVDLGVSTDTHNIPAKVVDAITGNHYSTQISLDYDGEFGFKATLTMDMGSENAGMFANLFYFNPDSETMEFICAGEIGEDGKTNLLFTHASDYLIVVADESMETAAADLSAGNTETSKGDMAVTTETPEKGWNPVWFILLAGVVILVGAGAMIIWKKSNR